MVDESVPAFYRYITRTNYITDVENPFPGPDLPIDHRLSQANLHRPHSVSVRPNLRFAKATTYHRRHPGRAKSREQAPMARLST